MRVLVVDDSVVIRRLISTMIENEPELDLAGTAANGKIALAKLPQLKPDAITMDVEMPEMNGIEAARAITKSYPGIPIIMVSSLTRRGAEATLDALQAGASDYIAKPEGMTNVDASINYFKEHLSPRIRAFQKEHNKALGNRHNQSKSLQNKPSSKVELLCIGISTGGPNALKDLFQHIPANLPVPILIVQHMPPVFTNYLAERLCKETPLSFTEASDGITAEAGKCYIAPGGKHMTVKNRNGKTLLRTNEDPLVNSCRPAVDVLFSSAAEEYGASVLGVVMTGMGNDGLKGSQSITAKGGSILVQNKESSVIWGMPGYIAEAGLASAVLPIKELAQEIVKRVNN